MNEGLSNIKLEVISVCKFFQILIVRRKASNYLGSQKTVFTKEEKYGLWPRDKVNENGEVEM